MTEIEILNAKIKELSQAIESHERRIKEIDTQLYYLKHNRFTI